MKYLKVLIIIILFAPCAAMAQESIGFDIVFGSYINDHHKKEFQAKERRWVLKDGELIYLIDAHDTRYTDTIMLKHDDIQSITKLIKNNKLNNSIVKDLSKDHLPKREWTVTIKGTIEVNDENFKADLKANSPSILDEDEDARRIKELEDLLYKIIEDY